MEVAEGIHERLEFWTRSGTSAIDWPTTSKASPRRPRVRTVIAHGGHYGDPATAPISRRHLSAQPRAVEQRRSWPSGWLSISAHGEAVPTIFILDPDK
jgi:hypothetical protein